MTYGVLLLLSSFLSAMTLCAGSRDAFYYRKSKTAARKELSSMTRMQRLLRKYSAAASHVPFHTVLFWRCRLLHSAVFAAALLLILLLPQTTAAVFFIKAAMIDLPI